MEKMGILKEPTPFALTDDGGPRVTPHNRTSSLAESGKAIMKSDAARAAQLKNLIGDRMREENNRAIEINQELEGLKQLRRHKENSETAWKNDSLFPSTTNQEYINQDVHAMSRPIDKTNFKKKNEYMAYVNSMFNSGVFNHPW